MSTCTYSVRTGDHDHTVGIDGDGAMTLDGARVDADIRCVDGASYSVVLRGASYHFRLTASDGRSEVLLDGVPVTVAVDNERTRLLRQFTGASAQHSAAVLISAPMPALVVRCEVSAGDTVTEGQGLVVLEAMKMENEIRSPRPGTVRHLHVVVGKTVEKGELLLTLE